VWFRAGVGRRNNADPKWLVPLFCRLGDITKQEIGAIRIFDRDTKFEIAPEAAARFAQAVAAAGENEVRIERNVGEPPGARPAGADKPGFRGKPGHRGKDAGANRSSRRAVR
jgi:ATP-dependent RNA helicase DeaD